MILTSKHKTLSLFSLLLVVGCFLCVQYTHAQSSLTLSVTPTLFEMSANPGQVWQSQVKVVNSNNFDIVVYPRALNFAPQGETGQGKFLPVFESMTDGATLAEWIEIDSAPIVVEREQSRTIPFLVSVPEDASPGGHFAAILVSTQPPDDHPGLAVKTAQIVTSLFFVRVSGDVNESGNLRTFTTADSFVQKPKVTFELRFENKGNVHLQPQGEIRIFNMWGKERGIIPINERTHFGNVLPESIRKFEFTWKGEQSFHDIGRYKAVASLAYGQEGKKFVTSTTHFWVVPVKPLLITVGSFIVCMYLVVAAIRMYVRRMLEHAGIQVVETRGNRSVVVRDGDVAVGSYATVSAPVRLSVQELRSRLSGVTKLLERVRVVIEFLFVYKKIVLGLIGLVVTLIVLSTFVRSALVDSRDFEVTIANPDSMLNLTAEEIAYDERATEEKLVQRSDMPETDYNLTLINTSGVAGGAGKVGALLTKHNYYFTELKTDEVRRDEKTKIVFDLALQKEALAISKLLQSALLSAAPDSASSTHPTITIYVGKDQIKKE